MSSALIECNYWRVDHFPVWSINLPVAGRRTRWDCLFWAVSVVAFIFTITTHSEAGLMTILLPRISQFCCSLWRTWCHNPCVLSSMSNLSTLGYFVQSTSLQCVSVEDWAFNSYILIIGVMLWMHEWHVRILLFSRSYLHVSLRVLTDFLSFEHVDQRKIERHEQELSIWGMPGG